MRKRQTDLQRICLHCPSYRFLTVESRRNVRFGFGRTKRHSETQSPYLPRTTSIPTRSVAKLETIVWKGCGVSQRGGTNQSRPLFAPASTRKTNKGATAGVVAAFVFLPVGRFYYSTTSRPDVSKRDLVSWVRTLSWSVSAVIMRL